MRHSTALVALALLGACASQPNREQTPPVGERAAAAALAQLGVPYRYGGNTPQGFDCSGLVQYAYARAGKSVPRTTGALWSGTRRVERAELQDGDLLFFRIDGKLAHVGLYIGGGQFVHAPSTGRQVTTESLQARFYRRAFVGAGRPP